MPFTWAVDVMKRRVEITVTMPYTRDDARAVATAIASDVGYDPKYPFLIDTFGDVRPSFVRDVAAFFETHRDKFSGARVAVVLPLGSRVDKHQDQEIEALHLPVTLRVFRSYASAERWLAREESPPG
jgi:hypothetical protein